jgi:hypothetical protein
MPHSWISSTLSEIAEVAYDRGLIEIGDQAKMLNTLTLLFLSNEGEDNPIERRSGQFPILVFSADNGSGG